MGRATPFDDSRKPSGEKLRPNPAGTGPGRSRPAQRSKTRDPAALEETESVCRLARKLLAQNDYAEAVRVLSEVPAEQGTDESDTLLEKASRTVEELDKLRLDIEAAIHTRRDADARKMVNRFLDIKPGDRRMQDLYEQLNTYGEGGAVRGMRRDQNVGQNVGSSGGLGMLFGVAGMTYGVMGLAFVAGLIAVTVYLKDEGRTVHVVVDDAVKYKEVGLGVGDRHYTIDSLRSVTLPPGQHTVSLTVARVEVESLEVSVEKGKPAPALGVSIEDGEPALRIVAGSGPTGPSEPSGAAASTPASGSPSTDNSVAAAPTGTAPAGVTPSGPATSTAGNPPPNRPRRGDEKPFELPANAPAEARLLFSLYEKIAPNTQWLSFQVKLKSAQRNANRGVSRPTEIPDEEFEVTGVSLPDGAGLGAADLALFRDHPALRSVTLWGTGWTGDELSGLAGHETIDFVGMQLSRPANRDQIRPCEAVPHLATFPALRHVLLEGVTVSDEDMKGLAACRRLDSIHITADGATGEGLAALSDLPDLRTLSLRWTHPDSTGPTDDDLAFLKGMSKLSQLTLSRCPELTGAGFQKAGRLPDLRNLTLIDCPQFNDDGLKALGVAAANLRFLSLNNGAAQSGIESAVTSKGLAGLRPLKSLDTLTIHSAREIVDFGIGILNSLPLRQVDLTGSGLTDAGMETLAKQKTITGLNLTRVQIGDDGCAELAKMSQLQDLTLDQTEISDDGLRKLAALKQLRRLRIVQTNTSKEAANELRDSVGRLRVEGP